MTLREPSEYCSYHDSQRYKQLVAEHMDGLREFRDGDWIEAKYYDLVYRIKGLIRYASAQCNCSKLMQVITAAKLGDLVSDARVLVAKACAFPECENDPDLVIVGKQLENVVVQARGKLRNGKERGQRRSIEVIHAKLLAA